jgi:hypothetical protein
LREFGEWGPQGKGKIKERGVAWGRKAEAGRFFLGELE